MARATFGKPVEYGGLIVLLKKQDIRKAVHIKMGKDNHTIYNISVF